MLIFSAPAPGAGGVTPNLVVTRDQRPRAASGHPVTRMEALLDAKIAEMQDNLVGFRLLDRRVLPSDGAATAEVRVAWNTPQAPVAQWVTFVENQDELIVVTATAAREDFPDVEPTFRQMMSTLRMG